jgi:hypothetical protein
VGAAVVGAILDGDKKRDEVVADDEKDEKDEAVSDEHVEKRESKA